MKFQLDDSDVDYLSRDMVVPSEERVFNVTMEVKPGAPGLRTGEGEVDLYELLKVFSPRRGEDSNWNTFFTIH